MAELTPKYIDATNLKALAMLALVGAGAYVVVGGLPVVAGSLVVALVLTVYHQRVVSGWTSPNRREGRQTLKERR